MANCPYSLGEYGDGRTCGVLSSAMDHPRWGCSVPLTACAQCGLEDDHATPKALTAAQARAIIAAARPKTLPNWYRRQMHSRLVFGESPSHQREDIPGMVRLDVPAFVARYRSEFGDALARELLGDMLDFQARVLPEHQGHPTEVLVQKIRALARANAMESIFSGASDADLIALVTSARDELRASLAEPQEARN